MANRSKLPKEKAAVNTYSARPDYHVFLTLVYHDLVDEVNASMGLRHVIKQLTKTNPHYAELFQRAGVIQQELEQMEEYLAQNPDIQANLQAQYGRKKNLANLLLEWRLQRPDEFQALFAKIRK
jgi:hypothetical protein